MIRPVALAPELEPQGLLPTVEKEVEKEKEVQRKGVEVEIKLVK
jgi:hypothetical protein